MSRPFLAVVTGLSGAGRSVALRALEDLNFYCMDHLPFPLVQSALDFVKNNNRGLELFAIGLDVSHQNSLQAIEELKKDSEIDLDIIFLTADENSLLRRFSTTRRKHPLLDSGGQLLSAIRREMDALSEIEKRSSVVFDTSQWTPHYLARQIEERYKKKSPGRHLHVTLSSFGFKYGIIRPCDMIIDVRFLKNPHFNEQYRELTGTDVKVQEYVKSDKDFPEFYKHLLNYMKFVLPKYYEEGKNYFRMGIGCTGGKHRSVTLAEILSQDLSKALSSEFLFSVHHRDIPIVK